MGTVSVFEDQPFSSLDLLEALPDGTAFLDDRGVMHFVNELLCELTGYARGELVGQNVQMLIPKRHRRAQRMAQREYANNPNARFIWSDQDLTVLCRDGSELSVDFALSLLTLDKKSWMVASIRDNRAGREAEQARLEADERFRLAFEDNMAPMVFTDLLDRIIVANDAFCEMIGYTKEELLGRDSKPFTYPEDHGITENTHERISRGAAEKVRYVKRYLHRDGRMIIVEVSKSPARDATGKTLYFVVSERDITEERALTARLSLQALHDPLTGLANRALFDDRLSQAHARVLRQGGIGAVLLLDLNDFKGVNDTFGHLVGDQLLTAIARRLETVTRSSDTLCRFGGDEFLYLAEGLDSAEQAAQVASRLLESLRQPFVIAGVQLEQFASIGVVVWDNSNVDRSVFIQNADVALYEAKHQGRGQYVMFTPSMQQQVASRHTLARELRTALTSGQLSMHYQPIVDLNSTKVLGFEALMRWNHPENGSVPPNVFIPLAEKSDLILDLGSFALREAIAAASSWDRGAPAKQRPYVTVNLSARQFHEYGLVDLIRATLEEFAVPPERLILEITEHVALSDVAETVRVVEQLANFGVGIALDDFGTGFSSLSYLSLLRPRFLKIDQSFIRPARESAQNDALLETIVSLGEKMDLTMLAEGIETTEQLGRLRHLGGELGQGYLFSAAVPASQVSVLLDSPWPAWRVATDAMNSTEIAQPPKLHSSLT